MARGVRHHRVFSSRRSPPYTRILVMLLMLSVVLLMLLALGIFSLPVNSDGAPKADHRTHRSMYNTDGLGKRGEQWTEVLSWEPRAFIFHNFLFKEECEYVIQLVKPHMEKSTVVDSTTGRSKDSRDRTSSVMFLKRGRD